MSLCAVLPFPVSAAREPVRAWYGTGHTLSPVVGAALGIAVRGEVVCVADSSRGGALVHEACGKALQRGFTVAFAPVIARRRLVRPRRCGLAV